MSQRARYAVTRLRAWEGAVELGLPFSIAVACWVGLGWLLGAPVGARRLTDVESALLFGASAALTGWAVGRATWLIGARRPRTGMIAAAAVVVLAASLTLWGGAAAFEGRCQTLGGALARTTDPTDGPATLCQIQPVPDNPKLPGILLRRHEVGSLWLALWMPLAAAMGALGRRDRRIFPSRAGRELLNRLAFAPAAGRASAASLTSGRLVACGNGTLWGEICAQLYAEDNAPAEGQLCVRCQQPFQRVGADRRLDVYSLVTADLDALHTWELHDTVTWVCGTPTQSHERSGSSNQPRWVKLTQIQVPEVLTVSQVLALVLDALPTDVGASPGDDPRLRAENQRLAQGIALARARASRVSAWLWFGASPESRRIDAQPTGDKVALAIGPMRLSDLLRGRTGEVHLQLEIGLLPLCQRYGQLLQGDVPHNGQSYLWIPVGHPGGDGAWIPRIEGEALRRWLSVERPRDADQAGFQLLPYAPDPKAMPGGLEWLLATLDAHGEPDVRARPPGASLAEWTWFEWKQVEMLRQHGIVLVDGRPVTAEEVG